MNINIIWLYLANGRSLCLTAEALEISEDETREMLYRQGATLEGLRKWSSDELDRCVRCGIFIMDGPFTGSLKSTINKVTEGAFCCGCAEYMLTGKEQLYHERIGKEVNFIGLS